VREGQRRKLIGSRGTGNAGALARVLLPSSTGRGLGVRARSLGARALRAYLFALSIHDLRLTIHGEKPMTYYYYQDASGEWRWRLKASNGRILADSGEGYKNKQDCLDDIDRVKASANAEVKEGS